MQFCDEALVSLEAFVMALKTNDVYIPIEDSTALEAIVGEKRKHIHHLHKTMSTIVIT